MTGTFFLKPLHGDAFFRMLKIKATFGKYKLGGRVVYSIDVEGACTRRQTGDVMFVKKAFPWATIRMILDKDHATYMGLFPEGGRTRIYTERVPIEGETTGTETLGIITGRISDIATGLVHEAHPRRYEL